jgi:hypothetical protein
MPSGLGAVWSAEISVPVPLSLAARVPLMLFLRFPRVPAE